MKDEMDELAAVILPRKKTHKKVFLAIFVEFKYSKGGFLANLSPLTQKSGFSVRTPETVRAKGREKAKIRKKKTVTYFDIYEPLSNDFLLIHKVI
jgi:hypothetical protein